MIKKCPYCGFEPIEDQLVCPKCGSKLNTENLKQETTKQTNTDQTPMANDDINWSNFEDVSLGSVIEHFHEVIEEAQPTEVTTESDLTKEEVTDESTAPILEQEEDSEPFEDNPILSAYIRRHKEGADEEELIAAIENQQQKEAAALSDEMQAKTPLETAAAENLREATTLETADHDGLKEDLHEDFKEPVKEASEVAVVKEDLTEELSENSTEELSETSIEESIGEPTSKATFIEAVETPEEVAFVEANQAVDFEENQTTNSKKAPVEFEAPLEKVAEEAVLSKAQSAAEKVDDELTQPEREVEQETNDSEQDVPLVAATPTRAMKEKSKSKKTRYLIGAASLLFVAGSWWLYSDYQAKEQAAQATALQTKKEFEALNTQLNQLFLDDQQEFLKPEVTSAQVKAIKQELMAYKTQDDYQTLAQLSETLYQKASLIETVNQYFTEPIVQGDELVKDVHIKDESPVVTSLVNDTTPFANLMNKALEQAKTEYQQVQSARTAVEKVTATLQEGQLTADFSKEALETTQKEVAQLFESPMKEDLIKALQPVEEALAASEAAEQEKQLAAQKKAEEEAAAAQRQASLSIRFNEGQEILSSSTPTNRNYQPIISSRQSDLNDMSNPAWQWAPGVYDTFINAVINKGYVVPGGFILEPVRIENGEGYYHLYATNNQSSLLKGIPQSSMPYYLVTVNAKTGFYKGNANR